VRKLNQFGVPVGRNVFGRRLSISISTEKNAQTYAGGLTSERWAG
jgi:hypothetical protein